jgi:hypothetical protein
VKLFKLWNNEQRGVAMYNKNFLAISLLIVFTLVFASFCFAEKVNVKVVEGIIEDVSDDSIKVREHNYNISGVPIKNASDETLSKAWLKTGKRVELFFKNNKITTILVYEEMVQ